MSSTPDSSRIAKLVSQLLLEDGDLRDIVEEFVEGLNTRLDELRQAHQKLDFDRLTLLAHRLKGAAGSYGYPEISQLCANMETRFREHQADDFARWLTQLSQLAEAARVGLEEKL
jgi:HPt (histidine-containing phosphotransfer) domain-containing protein